LRRTLFDDTHETFRHTVRGLLIDGGRSLGIG
jgi:hypothetical protein